MKSYQVSDFKYSQCKINKSHESLKNLKIEILQLTQTLNI